jgi:antitoxin MazE
MLKARHAVVFNTSNTPTSTRERFVDTMYQLRDPAMSTVVVSHISTWGNGLALRLTKPMAKAAGVAEGTPVRVTVRPGKIIIEAETEPTLDDMLAAFDPAKHGGEAMADGAVGAEAFA